jgi:hypothetical protein
MTPIEKLVRALAHQYQVPAEHCRNAALALIQDVLDGCEELGIVDTSPEVARFVKAYTHPVFVRLARDCGKPRVLPGVFQSYQKASQGDSYMADHIHHVVKEEGASALISVYEDEYEGEEFLRISTRVRPGEATPEEGEILVDGIRVVPSSRQISGIHPVDPRFYIRAP